MTLSSRSLTIAVLTSAAVKQHRDREGAVFVNLPLNHPSVVVQNEARQVEEVSLYTLLPTSSQG